MYCSYGMCGALKMQSSILPLHTWIRYNMGERYLRSINLVTGKIDVEAITVVPMYMKTHFVIAEGLKGAPPNLWENMRQHYISRVHHLDFDNVTGNQGMVADHIELGKIFV